MPSSSKMQLRKLGGAMRELRRARGVSQSSFAEEVGIDRTYISQIEAGAVNLSFEYISRIAACHRVALAELMRLAGI